jgi:DNA-binding transcriptional ArsR family regulator
MTPRCQTSPGVDPDLDRIFHAPADPGRRLMVDRLSQGPAAVTQLGQPLAMSLAAVLQHVQVLEARGLVSSQKIGRTRTCGINQVALRSAGARISERRALWQRRLDRLGGHLADAAGGLPPEARRTAASHATSQKGRRMMNERSVNHGTFVVERRYST